MLFTEVVQDALAAQLRGGGPKVIVAYLDVDRFKDINDTLGHHAGDELIKIVADRLQNTAQSGDFLARFGGDEFALLRVSNAKTPASAWRNCSWPPSTSRSSSSDRTCA